MHIKVHAFIDVRMTWNERVDLSFPNFDLCYVSWSKKLSWRLSVMHEETFHISGICCSLSRARPDFFFCTNMRQPAKWVVWVRGMSFWRENYDLWDAAGGITFAPSKFLWFCCKTKQKGGNMKRTEGTLHFTEDSKNCTGSCKTLITSYRLQSCSFYLINESKQKSNMWQTNHEVKASLTYHSGRTIIKVLWRANRRDIFSLIIEEDAYKSQKLLKF